MGVACRATPGHVPNENELEGRFGDEGCGTGILKPRPCPELELEPEAALSVDMDRAGCSPGVLSESSSSSAALDPEDDAIAFSDTDSFSYTGVKSGADEDDVRADRLPIKSA